jgi:hypothetical protein
VNAEDDACKDKQQDGHVYAIGGQRRVLATHCPTASKSFDWVSHDGTRTQFKDAQMAKLKQTCSSGHESIPQRFPKILPKLKLISNSEN